MSHTYYSINNKLKLAIAVNSIFTVAEFVAGIYSGSLALTADAAHNLTDVTSLVVSLAARIFSRRPASAEKTFGYARAPIVAALINACILLFLAFSLLYGAYERLHQPQPIESTIVISMALAGIIINAGSALLFIKNKHDINIHSSLLNLSFDALASAAALVTGIIIMLTGSVFIDTLVSAGLSLLLIVSAVRLARRAVHILLEGVPHIISLGHVRDYLQAIPGILTIHDLHIWTLSPEHTALTCHLVLDKQAYKLQDRLKQEIKQELYTRFGIQHSTLETELMHCTQHVCSLFT